MPLIRCMKCMEQYEESYGVCPYCGYSKGAAPPNPLYLPEGTVLDGRYLIGAVIGHGGFGITYIALDTSLDRKAAIKEYFPYGLSTRTSENPTVFPMTTQDAEENYRYGKEKFIEEAKTLAKFSSIESIVSVISCFTANNTAYFVMEHLEGEDLLQYVQKKGGKVTYDEAIKLVSPVFDALEAIHARGLIHRDISPDNIFITKEGKTKLLDFGTARFAMGEKSKSLSVILKPGYAPPEQYYSRGKQGPWTDVYALAATIYRLVTGTSPADSVERQADTSLDISAELNGKVPDAAKQVILRALDLDPAKRPLLSEFKQQFYKVKETGGKAPQPEKMQYITQPAAAPPQVSNFPRREEYSEPEPDSSSPEYEPGENKGRRVGLFASWIIILIVIAIVIVAGVELSNGNVPPAATTMQAPVSQAPASAAAVSQAPVSQVPQNQSISTPHNSTPPMVSIGPPSVSIPPDAEGSSDTTPVNIPDPGLKEGIIKTLQKMGVTINGDIVTAGDIQKITYLELASPERQTPESAAWGWINVSSDIQDLTGLEDATNLQVLKLCANKINNINPLAGLSKLTVLDLFSNNIGDISPLSGLTNLNILDLGYNYISDINPISGLTNLNFLVLNDNNINDINSLSTLTNLDTLYLGYNNISDITNLAVLNKLTDLYLYSNKISDISALSRLKNLICLNILGNSISDISILKNTENLKFLYIDQGTYNSNQNIIEILKQRGCVIYPY